MKEEIIDEITYAEAIKLLPKKDEIHTYVQCGPALIGASWTRERILEKLRMHRTVRTGENAAKMKHGLAFWDGDKNVFVETIE